VCVYVEKKKDDFIQTSGNVFKWKYAKWKDSIHTANAECCMQ